jgi:hypothetical protein
MTTRYQMMADHPTLTLIAFAVALVVLGAAKVAQLRAAR